MPEAKPAPGVTVWHNTLDQYVGLVRFEAKPTRVELDRARGRVRTAIVNAMAEAEQTSQETPRMARARMRAYLRLNRCTVIYDGAARNWCAQWTEK
jgi:hypothetical protein